ncbi:MAG: hypothetical protein ACFB02_08855 [Mastigocoleus sp.]
MLFILVISIISSIIGTLWLSIPIFIQLVIDKTIVISSFTNLSFYSLAIFGMILIAGFLDFRIVTFINRNFGNPLSSRIATALTSSRNNHMHVLSYKIAFEFPRAVISILLVSVMSINLTVVICLCASIVYSIYFLLLMRQINSSVYHSLEMQNLLPTIFPISARLVFSIITLFTFICGSYLVLNADLTLGQLIASCAIAIQLNISVGSMIHYLIYMTNTPNLT